MNTGTKRKISLLTRAVLDHIVETGPLFIDAFFPKYYPGTRPIRRLFGLEHIHYTSRAEAKHSISTILNRLKRDGLVQCTGPKKKAVWNITRQGTSVLKYVPLQVVISKMPRILPKEDGIIRLVTFDVPEKERKNRAWLRTELLASGFKPLQKSVFISKRPLSTNFIKMVDERGISKCMHIVALSKTGTISNVS